MNMFRSQRFIAQEDRLRKKATVDSDDYLSELEDLFRQSATHLPAGLMSDLFMHGVQSREHPDERRQALGDLLDLVWLQYDDSADPLDERDWSTVRDVIDQYAMSLDMSLVHYVMERVMSHHAIHRE